LKRKQQNFNCPEHSQGTALVRKPCGVIPAGKVDSSKCLTIKICVQNRVEEKVPLCTETLRFKKLLEIKIALLTTTLLLDFIIVKFNPC